MDDSRDDATRTLLDHAAGNERAADRLFPLVYDQLRNLAARYMRQERPTHTLQATALVHEAYMRLVDIDRIDWQGKTHFYAMAARQMRRILVEHARALNARKRVSSARRVTLDENLAMNPDQPLELIALDEALDKLGELSERQAKVAEMRLFAGMQVKEIAFSLGVSERTVKGDWRLARAWLMNAL